MGSILKDVHYVLHQAAIPSVPRSVNAPLPSHEANATGTLKVLEAARKASVKRVVYASSSSIYGDSKTLPKHEEMHTNPLSPYAVGKLAGENYVRVYSRIYGLSGVALRYFNVFGPRQDPKSTYAAVIPKFIQLIAAGKSPTINGDGKQSRDFTFIANVVEANIKACTAPDAGGRVFNIGLGERTTLLNLVAEINKILGKDVQPTFGDPAPGDVRDSLADINAAREILGYTASVSLAEGLQKTAEWLTQS
ncbi:NAD-dependent epimerase/dehydratase family protein [Myxococcota bacterium]|nr:NAD-dependent epimerase/dehydratase family protein [Myxococcota bacterium]